MDFSLVAASRAYPLVVVHGLLIVVASHCRAQALGHEDSVVAAHRLSCSEACGIFPDQGQVPCIGSGFSTTGPPGKSHTLDY